MLILLLPKRDKKRGLDLRKKRKKWSKTDLSSAVKFGPPFNSQTKGQREHAGVENVRYDISASKSFILGDAQSNLMNAVMDSKDVDMLRKNGEDALNRNRYCKFFLFTRKA